MQVILLWVVETRADLADFLGVDECLRRGGLGGDHGGRGHVRVQAVEEDAARVEEGPDTGDGVGAVLEGGAEGGADRGGGVGRKGLVFGGEGLLEDVEGMGDGGMFGEGGGSFGFEVFFG